MVAVAVFAGALAISILIFYVTPQSFLPDEDQGAIFAALRLPEGASVNRTEAVVKQVEDIVRPIPGVEGILSVVGLNFIDYVASSNQAFFVIRLKPYEQRTDPAQSANAIIARLRPQLAAIPGAVAFPFNLPPILGLGSNGGFQYLFGRLASPNARQPARVLSRALPIRLGSTARPNAERPRRRTSRAACDRQQPTRARWRIQHLRGRYPA